MKYLFLVQGEGRGHMTQAIELSAILKRNGHEVVHTFIGKSSRRNIPDYFFEQIGSSADTIQSPNFILDKDNKSLDLWKSITFNARLLGTYKKSLQQIHDKVKHCRPDVIVNFYDFIGGFYFRFYNPPTVKHVCIGRQFLTLHPQYIFEKGRIVEKRLFLLNNWLTSQKCDKYLALSFRPYDPLVVGNMVVTPPLLKSEIKALKPVTENFILGYLVNDGYAEDIMTWHQQNPEVVIHCFWDRKNMPKSFSTHENLTFHQIDNLLFTDYMRRCKGYISTAGFESICEAMYLGKPALMIPVDGQYEQACNAIDAEISGAGKRADAFDISLLQQVIEDYSTAGGFKNWVNRAESIFLDALTNF
jgi:uncharacterized protein (TIGR00661 family)